MKLYKITYNCAFLYCYSTQKLRGKKTVFHEKIHSFSQKINHAFWELNILSYRKGSPVIRRTRHTLSSRAARAGPAARETSHHRFLRLWERRSGLGARREYVCGDGNVRTEAHACIQQYQGGAVRPDRVAPWQVTAVARILFLFEFPRKLGLEKKALRKK